MTSIDDFPVVRLIGDDPAPGKTLLNAPRPLYGEPVDVDVMGFTVDVGNLRPDTLEENHRLDAKRLTWTTRADAVAQVRDRVIREYGSGALDGLTDDDLLGMWHR